MKPSLHYTLRLFLSLLLPVGLLLVMNLIPTVPATTVTAAADCASSGVPIVTTDKADYGPSEIVMISAPALAAGIHLLFWLPPRMVTRGPAMVWVQTGQIL